MICNYINCSNPLDFTIQKNRKYCSLPCSYKQRGINSRGRNPHKKNCLNCNHKFETLDKRQKFCSHSCAAKMNNLGNARRKKTGKEKKCKHCKNIFYERNSQRKDFCGKECKDGFLIDQWIRGEIDGNGKYAVRTFVRKYIIDRDKVCQSCQKDYINPYSQKSVLQINHIDGDWRNSTPENLELLCPTCHSLTPNYGALNKMNGRAWKKNYQQYELKAGALAN